MRLTTLYLMFAIGAGLWGWKKQPETEVAWFAAGIAWPVILMYKLLIYIDPPDAPVGRQALKGGE